MSLYIGFGDHDKAVLTCAKNHYEARKQIGRALKIKPFNGFIRLDGLIRLPTLPKLGKTVKLHIQLDPE